MQTLSVCSPAMTKFAEFFAHHLLLSGMSRRAFASKAGTSAGFLTNICDGSRTPPLDRLNKWADLLKLSGSNRTEFMELAYLAHAPEEVRAMVGELRRKGIKMRENQRLILQELSRRGIQVPGLSDDI